MKTVLLVDSFEKCEVLGYLKTLDKLFLNQPDKVQIIQITRNDSAVYMDVWAKDNNISYDSYDDQELYDAISECDKAIILWDFHDGLALKALRRLREEGEEYKTEKPIEIHEVTTVSLTENT